VAILGTVLYLNRETSKAMASGDNACTAKNLEQDERINAISTTQSDILDILTQNRDTLIRIEGRVKK
jgi:hypothetical protein